MSAQDYTAANHLDDEGRPAGGFVSGVGLRIDWQDGPLAVNGIRREPNGAFVETVIEAAKQRIEHYQTTQFHCEENARAVLHLEAALDVLNSRTARRVAAGIEGTHQGN